MIAECLYRVTVGFSLRVNVHACVQAAVLLVCTGTPLRACTPSPLVQPRDRGKYSCMVLYKFSMGTSKTLSPLSVQPWITGRSFSQPYCPFHSPILILPKVQLFTSLPEFACFSGKPISFLRECLWRLVSWYNYGFCSLTSLSLLE